MLIHADSRTDMTNLVGAFNDYATPPKKTIHYINVLTSNLFLLFLIIAICNGFGPCVTCFLRKKNEPYFETKLHDKYHSLHAVR